MRRYFIFGLCLIVVFCVTGPSLAHFGTILPDKSMVMQVDNPNCSRCWPAKRKPTS
jgi:hypothetical protein